MSHTTSVCRSNCGRNFNISSVSSRRLLLWQRLYVRTFSGRSGCASERLFAHHVTESRLLLTLCASETCRTHSHADTQTTSSFSWLQKVWLRKRHPAFCSSPSGIRTRRVAAIGRGKLLLSGLESLTTPLQRPEGVSSRNTTVKQILTAYYPVSTTGQKIDWWKLNLPECLVLKGILHLSIQRLSHGNWTRTQPQDNPTTSSTPQILLVKLHLYALYEFSSNLHYTWTLVRLTECRREKSSEITKSCYWSKEINLLYVNRKYLRLWEAAHSFRNPLIVFKVQI